MDFWWAVGAWTLLYFMFVVPLWFIFRRGANGPCCQKCKQNAQDEMSEGHLDKSEDPEDYQASEDLGGMTSLDYEIDPKSKYEH